MRNRAIAIRRSKAAAQGKFKRLIGSRVMHIQYSGQNVLLLENKMFCYWKTKCFVIGKQNVLLLENKMFWRYKQNVLALETKCFSVRNKMF